MTISADVEIAVVGAGPHGLSAAIHLRRAGADVRVFGDTMSFWRGMPKGMKLRSNMSATNMIDGPVGPLSLKSFTLDSGSEFGYPVPLERFIEYGEWVQRRAVPDVDRRLATRLEGVAGAFNIELSDGTHMSARRVVLACGIARFAYVPDGFGHLPPDRCSHTGEHRDMGAFSGKRLAVIGGGQSAFECAALAQEAGASTEALVRAKDVVWLRQLAWKTRLGRLGPVVYAPTDVGPAWFSRLVAAPALFRLLPPHRRERIAYRCIRPACSHFVQERLDDVKLSLGVQLVAAAEHGPSLRLWLSDGTTREVDHVLFGTGYRVDIAGYSFLGDSVLDGLDRVHGYPVLRRGFESTVPGLHVVGAPAARSFGPIVRFVSGSWYAGRAVAQSISERRRVARPLGTTRG